MGKKSNNIQTELQYQKMIKLTLTAFLLSVILLQPALCYIDIDLQIASSSSDIAFNVPITISGQKYHIAISLQNKEEFIVSPAALKHKSKTAKTHTNNLPAEMQVSSLQGYNLQGWRRFFMQVVLFVDSRYAHTLHFNVTDVKQTDKFVPLTNGLMTLGPKISENRFYTLIKQQTQDYFKDDVVSFYITPGSKELKMQLGGYEEQNARGYKNGIKFYQKPIELSQDGKKWVIPISKLTIAKQKGRKWQCYSIPSSAMKPKLSVESQYIILPQSFKQDLQTSFQSESIECSFESTSQQLQCSNISSIDEALTFLSFAIEENVTLNISLYDLRDQYNSKEKITSFFVKLGSESELQIGSPLLKGYYISLNMAKPSILFSPNNRFSPEITTVSILRFIIVFIVFMLAACIVIILWQQCSNPDRSRNLRFTREKNGVRLVSYQRPSEFEQED